MDIQVDAGRLGQEAGALGAQGSWLDQARDDLSAACSVAGNSCGSVNDDGLRQALQNLSTAWGFETAAVGNDISSVAGVMTALARLYTQVDAQGAQVLGE